MREIILDLEMSGLELGDGHRIIEIGAIEVIDGQPTGNFFHCYCNPLRPVDPEAFAVHGLSDEFLAEQPRFAEIAADLRSFIGDSRLVITCRTFDGHTLDIDFLTHEFAEAGEPALASDQWLNVRRWSEAMYGDVEARLDNLLDRYGVDRTQRETNGHGALLDASLLAAIYPRLKEDYQTFIADNNPPPPGKDLPPCFPAP